MQLINYPCYKYNGNANVQVGVLHHTAGGLESALATLWGNAEVSINYLIDKLGRIWYGVPVGKRAWHCGRSVWHGKQDSWGSVNGICYGVELVNLGNGSDPFTQEQLDALDWILVHHAYPISGKVNPLTRHRDISLEGKIDPADNFPWELYSQGIKAIEKRLEEKEVTVELADIETIELIKEQAKHPSGREVYSMAFDETMEDNWIFVRYPHYGRLTEGQPETLKAWVYVVDKDGGVHWQEETELGKDLANYSKVWKIPEIKSLPGGINLVQVDYETTGLGQTPYIRRIRV